MLKLNGEIESWVSNSVAAADAASAFSGAFSLFLPGAVKQGCPP
jgi:hypothetical protein